MRIKAVRTVTALSLTALGMVVLLVQVSLTVRLVLLTKEIWEEPVQRVRVLFIVVSMPNKGTAPVFRVMLFMS